MLTETFVLDPRFPECTLTAYIHEPFEELAISARRAMIVCPGGAYEHLSEREGEPVALQFFAAGMNVFLLRYSLGAKTDGKNPIIEAALAIRHIREHAGDYHIDPAYVFISGFSAGGHLSACACTLWKHPVVTEAVGGDPRLCRPTAGVLCYPYVCDEGYKKFVSVKEYLSVLSDGAMSMLLGWPADRYVEADTSPAFIWHTFDDEIVPIQNTLIYASALAEAGVPFEYHVYPHGPHGLSLATRESAGRHSGYEIPVIAAWIRDAIRYCTEFKA